MKVLHVIPSISARSGGPGQAILPMCRSLSAQGIEVLLTTTDDDLNVANGGPEPERGAVTNYRNLPVIFFPKQLGASFKVLAPVCGVA